MTDNLSKMIQKESFSVADGQRSANLTLHALKGMRTEIVAKLLYETIGKKATKREFIDCPILPRERKRADYIKRSKSIFR